MEEAASIDMKAILVGAKKDWFGVEGWVDRCNIEF